jgi:hypothetical protein
MSLYAYVVAFYLIIIGLLWDLFQAIQVFAVPVLLLIISGFMGKKAHLHDFCDCRGSTRRSTSKMENWNNYLEGR